MRSFVFNPQKVLIYNKLCHVNPEKTVELENYDQGSLPQHKADISLSPLWEAAVGGTTGAAASLVQRLPLISGAEHEADSLQSLRDSLKLNRPRFYGILQKIPCWRSLYGVDRFSQGPVR